MSVTFYSVDCCILSRHEMLTLLHGKDCRVFYIGGLLFLQDKKTRSLYLVSEEKTLDAHAEEGGKGEPAI